MRKGSVYPKTKHRGSPKLGGKVGTLPTHDPETWCPGTNQKERSLRTNPMILSLDLIALVFGSPMVMGYGVKSQS